MRKMTDEDKQKILQQVELFRREKMTFDTEVAKWDDAGNDIIVLAKHMCMIMMEMTDFTRWVWQFRKRSSGSSKSLANYGDLLTEVVARSRLQWTLSTLLRRSLKPEPNLTNSLGKLPNKYDLIANSD